MGSEVKTWVRWEEETVSNDRGRREVHYYVRDDSGNRDLAVVGREKSARHMVYAVHAKFFHSLIGIPATDSPASAASAAAAALPADLRLRSRRQAVDWLSLLISDSTAYGLSPVLDRFSDVEVATPASIPNSKVPSCQMGRQYEKFSWLGSSWECRKRWKHYQSFRRNGITISVHDFIYVLAEDNKRLVAYVEDLYEDVRANNMVAVRWFHKVDEVSIVLPPDAIDREIFFTLCLQDFSVECIDGLAVVLGSEDFDKFQKEAHHRHRFWDPYLCRRQIDDDCTIKSFDITQVQGYWVQGLLRSMYPSYLKLRLKIKGRGSAPEGKKINSDFRVICKRKLCSSVSGSIDVAVPVKDVGNLDGLGVENRFEKPARVDSSVSLEMRKGLVKRPNVVVPGHEIELLSQDSGIRGCWFCCTVLKCHRDKIKVRYRDVEDADGSGNLEEWVSTSRTAALDKLGIRMCGRPIFRPNLLKMDEKLSSCYEVGKAVDAWWHDGWWEGIVINNESEGKIHVYFPGEQRASIFSPVDLRPSQEWVDNKWNQLKERSDIAALLLSELDREKCSDCITFQGSPSDAQTESLLIQEKGDPLPAVTACGSPFVQNSPFPDLFNGYIQDGLKWSSSKKRTSGRLFSAQIFGSKRRVASTGRRSGGDLDRAKDRSAFPMPKSLKGLDRENCKGGSRDTLFGSSMPLCSNMVMTR